MILKACKSPFTKNTCIFLVFEARKLHKNCNIYILYIDIQYKEIPIDVECFSFFNPPLDYSSFNDIEACRSLSPIIICNPIFQQMHWITLRSKFSYQVMDVMMVFNLFDMYLFRIIPCRWMFNSINFNQ